MTALERALWIVATGPMLLVSPALRRRWRSRPGAWQGGQVR